jgi:ABC-type uncharacterized transport system involved in gliding motility auxiliary subunit
MAQARKEDFTGGQKLLGAALVGTFASAYETRPVPHPTDSAAMTPLVQVTTQSPETRMVVIGDGNFIQGQFAGGSGPILFLNAVDWLSQDSDLMTIRSRDATTRPLRPDITDAGKRTVKYAGMLLPPVLTLVVGLARWTVRRNRRKELTV